VVRHRIRLPQGLENLATYLMSNVAQEYSHKTLATVTGLRSAATVEKYLRYLEEAFLFFSVRRFSFKVREQARLNPKVYCTDNGLAGSASFRFSSDVGKLFENLVAIALRRSQLDGELDFYFWKGPQQEEVDFVVKRGLRVTQLIQVCQRLDDPRTKDREIQALLKASEQLSCDDLVILTERDEGEERVSWFGRTGTIRFVPLWKWLARGQKNRRRGVVP
jgi:predicted AAA+ superfamily ATPase